MFFPNQTTTILADGSVGKAYARYTRYPDSWTLSEAQVEEIQLHSDEDLGFDEVHVKVDGELADRAYGVRQGQQLAAYSLRAVRFMVSSGLAKLITTKDGVRFWRFPLSHTPAQLQNAMDLAAGKAAAAKQAPASPQAPRGHQVSNSEAEDMICQAYPELASSRSLGTRLSVAKRVGLVEGGRSWTSADDLADLIRHGAQVRVGSRSYTLSAYQVFGDRTGQED